MKYFKFTDDVYVPNRWHLGEIFTADGEEPTLTLGVAMKNGGSQALTTTVTSPGNVLDFSLTSFGVPVASADLTHAIVDVASSEVQVLPVEINSQPGMFVLNVVRVVDCLDESRSEFIKWTENDHRADLAGQYRQVTRLVLAAARIPDGAHMFRVKGWEVAIVVSASLKDAIVDLGASGTKFVDVTP